MDVTDLTVDGESITTAYDCFVTNKSSFPAPDPKTYDVDIPGGGTIDLTEALTGDVAYENRSMTVQLAFREVSDWESLKSRVWRKLHGKRFDFVLGCDPGYTYTGRWKCTGSEFYGIGTKGSATMTFRVDADPYKLKEHCAFRLNATGGRWYRFESGRRPVHPVVECADVCRITWNGIEQTIPAGAYRLNDVTFTEGMNELYVNSREIWMVDWDGIGKGGTHAMTWAEAEAYTWDDVQRLGVTDSAPQDWLTISEYTWADLGKGAAHESKWADLNYSNTADSVYTDATVYLTYDWEDL